MAQKIPIPYELHFNFPVFCVTFPETKSKSPWKSAFSIPKRKCASEFKNWFSRVPTCCWFQGPGVSQVVVLRRRILWLCTSLSGDSLVDWLQTHRADGTTGVRLTCRPNDSGLVVVPTPPPPKQVKMDGLIVSGPENHFKKSLKLPPISP